jgi:hypothetical protein
MIYRLKTRNADEREVARVLFYMRLTYIQASKLLLSFFFQDGWMEKRGNELTYIQSEENYFPMPIVYIPDAAEPIMRMPKAG